MKANTYREVRMRDYTAPQHLPGKVATTLPKRFKVACPSILQTFLSDAQAISALFRGKIYHQLFI